MKRKQASKPIDLSTFGKINISDFVDLYHTSVSLVHETRFAKSLNKKTFFHKLHGIKPLYLIIGQTSSVNWSWFTNYSIEGDNLEKNSFMNYSVWCASLRKRGFANYF